MKVKSDTICVVFLLVFGAFFVFLGLSNWLGLSGPYAGGLTLMLMSFSYTKYKVYAKYFVPMLLICGATIAVLGWFLLPPVTTLKILTIASGIGVFAGGIANLIVSFGGKRK
jgi:hypothetical protein